MREEEVQKKNKWTETRVTGRDERENDMTNPEVCKETIKEKGVVELQVSRVLYDERRHKRDRDE